MRRVDFARDHFRELLIGGDSRIHLSVIGHTMELYRRLPCGWQPTPDGIYTDLHFWLRLQALPGTRIASGTRPTVLHFPNAMRAGWSIDERLAEIDRWQEPGMADTLPQRLLDNVLPDRAALDEALTSREREVHCAHCARGRSRAAKPPSNRPQLQVIADSVTWRLRGRILSVPGGQSGCEGASSASSACSG